MLLAGDLGGTKTKLAVYSKTDGANQPLFEKTYSSAQFGSFVEMLDVFLAEANLAVTHACFGVAGPVVDGVCHLTNLPWCLDEAELERSLQLKKVHLLNDLAAIAAAVPSLMEKELITVHAGKPVARAPKAIIAPGTGLGESFLTWQGQHYEAHPSEGGHVEFGPRNKQELELLTFLMSKYGHVSYELICSGIGLPNIFEFVCQTRRGEAQTAVLSALADAKDPTRVLIHAALSEENPCPVCVDALRLFVSILGAEAGNLALKIVARGGVYLGGGISIVLQQALKMPEFMQAFCDKGRLSAVLNNIPVHIITADDVGLRGAAIFGLGHLLP